MNWDEKKIVLNYLQSLYFKEKKYGGFVILNEMYAKNKAIKKYEESSINDRELILKRIVIDYLIDESSKSLVLYNVHGHANRRLLRLKELMYHKYDSMSSIERAIICDKILNN